MSFHNFLYTSFNCTVPVRVCIEDDRLYEKQKNRPFHATDLNWIHKHYIVYILWISLIFIKLRMCQHFGRCIVVNNGFLR